MRSCFESIIFSMHIESVLTFEYIIKLEGLLARKPNYVRFIIFVRLITNRRGKTHRNYKETDITTSCYSQMGVILIV